MSGIDVRYNRLPTQKILVETSVGDPEILSAKVRIRGKAWHGGLHHRRRWLTRLGLGARGKPSFPSKEGQGEKKGGSKKSACWVSVGALGFKGPAGKIPYSVA